MSCGCKTPSAANAAGAAGAAGAADAADAAGAASAVDSDDAGCSGGESFALRVLGDEMAPEFLHGEIIIIEPDGALRDGSFVLARLDGEWIFRQLCQREGGWALHALQAGLPDRPLPDLSAVHGVIIQKAVPGRRKLSRFYT